MRILYQITTCLILTAIVVELCILLTLISIYPSDQWPNDSYNIRNIDLPRRDVSLQQQLRLSDSANDSASSDKKTVMSMYIAQTAVTHRAQATVHFNKMTAFHTEKATVQLATVDHVRGAPDASTTFNILQYSSQKSTPRNIWI